MAIIPIYDYSLVTQPLSDSQLEAIGWVGRYGIADSGNQFHYSRKTADNRILWAGYDAIYHFGGERGDARLQRGESFERPDGEFYATALFPTLCKKINQVPAIAWGGVHRISLGLRNDILPAWPPPYGEAARLCAGLYAWAGVRPTAAFRRAWTMLNLLRQGRDTERTLACHVTFVAGCRFPTRKPFRYLAVATGRKRDLARED